MSTAQAPWTRRKEDREPWPADDIGHAALGDHGAAHAAGAFDDDEPPMAAGAITVPLVVALLSVLLWLAIVAWPNY